MAERGQHVVQLTGGRRRGEAGVEQCAALELDPRLQAADREEEDAGDDEQRGKHEVPVLALDEAEQHQAGAPAVGRGVSRASAGRSSTPQSLRRRRDWYSIATCSRSWVTNTAVKKETTTP